MKNACNNNVIPAKAGIPEGSRGSADKTHVAADAALRLDPRLRGDDDFF
jgi:hypothetical protein